MNMGEDATLLREYAENGSDRAFSALLEGHFNLVYATALRIAHGDAHLAQDVAQNVFTDFARKAKLLPRDLLLGGWLYKHTCFMAANAVRKEQRRRTRERQAFEMNSSNELPDPIWSRVAPLLDEAMARLGTSDRDALVLRFFEQKPFRTVGAVLGISEDAARKRVDRALDKLRGFFARRGLSFSAAVLGCALDSHAAAAAPAGLASLVAGAALAEAAQSAGTGLSLIKLITLTRLMTITKAKIAVSAVTAAMTAALLIQSHDNSRLEREIRDLRQQAALSDKPRTENPRPAPASGLDQNQFRELLRLRGEVGLLKEQLAQTKKTPEAKMDHPRVGVPTQSAPADPVEQQRQIMAAKMNYTKQWMLALVSYAQEHQQTLPTDFKQTAAYWPDGENDTNIMTDQFQIVYQGAYNEISNPADTIVLRETTPMQSANGSWLKTYGFADGHSQIVEQPDGNFDAWESQHMQKPAGQ